MLHGAFKARQRATTVLKRCWHNRQHVSKRGLLTLAIETSCDDTCVAILEKDSHNLDKLDDDQNQIKSAAAGKEGLATKLHFHEKITARNTGLGGIHPLEALDSHRANLSYLIARSLAFLPTSKGDARKSVVGVDGSVRQKPDFISVTRGPGMRSNLSCGLDTAKGLSVAWQIPLLGVHHMQAHTLTPRLVHAMEKNVHTLSPSFPFLTLLVSGGHTMLLYSTDLTTHKILATTADVAIGDALDKGGRLLLPDEIKAVTKDTAYAKYLSDYAFPTPEDFKHWVIPTRRAEEIDRPSNKYGWRIHAPFAQSRDLTFSFASIPTMAEKIVGNRGTDGSLEPAERLLLARTVLGTAFEHLGSRVVIALESLRRNGQEVPTLVISGGVAANDFLRYFLRSMLNVRGFENVELVFPPVSLCTDNAAMIAWTGMEMFEAGFRSELSIGSLRKWSMDAENEDGGILGVGGWTQVTE